ncbi:hypothetical protein I6G56_08915 [Burkholderia humptydooensis]|uniref:Uncharacterized protein n=2 Tax=Burkholderia humptydooensis TaxID=430531 RepID=A0A7U4P4T4_9BURK|nr:hypothetical protein [Burkholderia humptydooensis]AJY41816.1 hypothetical protein BW21_2413 [Burkholderia sp. 2002721687]ALX42960.1 hypothetical protein AQ610_11415 [Burkholderia humptydooensis]EIP87441.1 hypothetical protein A33K_15461 [Burkholderia humptydooensis MSMB43]QPS45154.1 hypothetical protein I6G56_08915 [Burkholderia humptydooensis]
MTPFGPIRAGKLQKGDKEDQYVDEAEARRRGWGSVYRSSYQPVLAWLEEQLNEAMHLNEMQGQWIDTDPDGKKWTLKPVLGTEPADYGATDAGAQGRGRRSRKIQRLSNTS